MRRKRGGAGRAAAATTALTTRAAKRASSRRRDALARPAGPVRCVVSAFRLSYHAVPHVSSGVARRGVCTVCLPVVGSLAMKVLAILR